MSSWSAALLAGRRTRGFVTSKIFGGGGRERGRESRREPLATTNHTAAGLYAPCTMPGEDTEKCLVCEEGKIQHPCKLCRAYLYCSKGEFESMILPRYNVLAQ